MEFVALFLISALVSFALGRPIRTMLRRLKAMDLPNERSSHLRATPRGGGIGFIVTWMVGCLAWLSLHMGGRDLLGPYLVLLVSSLFISGISLWDDFHNIGVGIRMAFHLACTAAVIVAFGWFKKVDIGWPVLSNGTSLLVTVLWVAGLTNVFNFMDGIDGIAGLQGVIAGSAWCVAGVLIGVPSVSAMSALLAGGGAGFLLHNWSPAKIFMGDVGSAFFGFVLGVFPLVALRGLPTNANPAVIGRLPVFAVLVVWPFVADGAFTFCRRLFKGEPVWKPHRSHFYQRLVQAGLSHSTVASYYGVWAVTCSVAGLFYLKEVSRYWTWGVPLLFVGVTWVTTLHLEQQKKTVIRDLV
jgi:UDP-N-acetylmuramyl pentapeptide phosphotransferase/UDP-N-acetylglucosamine-1-phosphate transferase